MPTLTPEQLQMNQGELSGGSAGMATYTARIAALRGEQAPTTTQPTGLSSIVPTETLAINQPRVNIGAPVPAPMPPIVNDTQVITAEDPFKAFKDYISQTAPPPSSSGAYVSTYGTPDTPEQIAAKEAAVKVSTDRINALNAQIQGIINAGTVGKLTAESQMQGRLGSILSAEQAELDRQTAIKVLPLQSQALVEQAILSGNQSLLTQAQGKVDAYFKFQQQDEQNKYEYRQGLIDKFFNYADREQQNRLDEKKTANAQAFQLATSNRSDQNSWASAAISNGQGMLASQIMSLDATSSTFQQNLANLAGQIKEKKETIPSTTGGRFNESLKKCLADNNSPQTCAQSSFEYFKELGYDISYQDLLIDAEGLQSGPSADMNILPGAIIPKESTMAKVSAEPQYVYSNYKPAGEGYVWTPDKRRIKESDISSDIEKHAPSVNYGVTTGQGGVDLWSWIKNLFGGGSVEEILNK
ncbi:MAG: hypothetical protein WC437_04625 [Patescibacteria group bacterium]